MIYIILNQKVFDHLNFRELINKKGAFANFVQNYMKTITDQKEVLKIKEIVKSVSTEECYEKSNETFDDTKGSDQMWVINSLNKVVLKS